MADSKRDPGSFYLLSYELLSAAYPEASADWIDSQAAVAVRGVNAALGTAEVPTLKERTRSGWLTRTPNVGLGKLAILPPDYRWHDLSGSSLRRAKFHSALLVGADLRGADLSEADLHDADLRWADLGESDLRGADLRAANLRWADLRGADLEGADLRSSNMRGAELGGANLNGARLPEHLEPVGQAPDFETLIALALAGDRLAAEELVTFVRPLVLRYVGARLGRPAEPSAEDVTNEICDSIIQALPSYRRQKRPFLAFVYGIAAHKIAGTHRALAREEVRLHSSEHPEPEDDELGRAQQDAFGGHLASLLSMLPAKQREVLVLRVVLGFSAEETAKAVGSSPGAVRVAQHRALSRLRKFLSTDIDSAPGE
jgi:RNA polymerase sigma-70 factor (ECF subfamily)